MNNKQQIQELWSYLKIQANELLVLKNYNQLTRTDEYILAKMVNNQLDISVTSEMPQFNQGEDFLVFKHLNADGKCDIPSVAQLEIERNMDY